MKDATVGVRVTLAGQEWPDGRRVPLENAKWKDKTFWCTFVNAKAAELDEKKMKKAEDPKLHDMTHNLTRCVCLCAEEAHTSVFGRPGRRFWIHRSSRGWVVDITCKVTAISVGEPPAGVVLPQAATFEDAGTTFLDLWKRIEPAFAICHHKTRKCCILMIRKSKHYSTF